MATSHYFKHFPGRKSNEQLLYEDLLVESIKIMGHDVYYLPREDWDDTDMIFGENLQSKFERAYQMEMYLANVEGFEGDSEFFSKFGVEIRDTSNFIIAKRTFERYMPSNIARRPREGDLVYIPVFQKIFEIKFVEEELMFFTKGNKSPYIYELRAEAFRYANEQIDTGVEEIDDIQTQSVYTVQFTLGGSGNYHIGEIVYQGSNIINAIATAEVSDWVPANGTIQLVNIKGNFATSANLTGATSGTRRVITTADTMGDHTYYDLYNNKDIQTEANNFIDMSEINPFGTP